MLDSDLLMRHHDTEIHGDANAEMLNGYDASPQKGRRHVASVCSTTWLRRIKR